MSDVRVGSRAGGQAAGCLEAGWHADNTRAYW